MKRNGNNITEEYEVIAGNNCELDSSKSSFMVDVIREYGTLVTTRFYFSGEEGRTRFEIVFPFTKAQELRDMAEVLTKVAEEMEEKLPGLV